MANVKISMLPDISQYSMTDVLPIVDGLATNKIEMKDILRNTTGVTESSINTSAIMIATDGSGTQVLQGTNSTSAVVASYGSFINNGQNMFIGGTNNSSINNGSGHSAIVGSDSVSITGGYNHFIAGSYNGPSIIGGEENVILASIGGTQVSNNNNSAISTQGVVIDGSKTSAIACEGSAQQAGQRVLLAGGYNYQGQINNLINQAHLGFKNLNVGDGVAGFNVGGSLGTEDCAVTKTRSVMSAASGRTTLYETTLHTDNLYSFERIQSATNVTTTIANEQFLTGGLGMVQYTDVSAGNLNLRINGVRNGEVYHWVIDNQSGGSVSINSVATDTGFTITDNSSNSLTTGPHIFTIVVVNDLIIIEGTH
jgi:hypothetical protein